MAYQARVIVLHQELACTPRPREGLRWHVSVSLLQPVGIASPEQVEQLLSVHSAPHIINVAHEEDLPLNLSQAGRAFRVLVTVVDQATQGKRSARFTEEERGLDGLPPSELVEDARRVQMADGECSEGDKRCGVSCAVDVALRS